MKKSQPQINPDDTLFWDDFTKDVIKTNQPEHIKKERKELPEIRNSIDNTHVYNGNKLNDLVLGKISDIDLKTAQKFRRGEFKKRFGVWSKTFRRFASNAEAFCL